MTHAQENFIASTRPTNKIVYVVNLENFKPIVTLTTRQTYLNTN